MARSTARGRFYASRMMYDPLTNALHWLDQGVTPIPLKPASKLPLIPWRRIRERRPPEAVVRRWFSNWPDANLGLLCGNALTVLDFDRALEYWKWLRSAMSGALPRSSYTVQTSRGYHVYLHVMDAPDRTLSMEGGECKGSGYVVAPPSIHPSGTKYIPMNLEPVATIRHLSDVGVFPVEVIASRPVDSDTRPPERSGPGIVNEIKQELPILSVLAQHTNLFPSSPDGNWLMAVCPLHDDHNPSMWVNVRMGLCRCFVPGCPGADRAMDVINLYALLKGITNEQAIYTLAGQLGL